MSDDTYHRRSHRSPDWTATLARVRGYLASRPRESWLFFFAGIVAGAILG